VSDNLFAMQVGNWHLGGWHEVKVIPFAAVLLFFELRQLRCANERLASDDKRRLDLCVSIVPRLEVEQEINQARSRRAPAPV
jgi:hypothetical protein